MRTMTASHIAFCCSIRSAVSGAVEPYCRKMASFTVFIKCHRMSALPHGRSSYGERRASPRQSDVEDLQEMMRAGAPDPRGTL